MYTEQDCSTNGCKFPAKWAVKGPITAHRADETECLEL